MKKNVKKCVFGVLAVVMLAGLFTGCKSQVVGKCDSCKEEKPLYVFNFKVKGEKDDGGDVVCEDCAEPLITAAKMLIEVDSSKYSYEYKPYKK